jgi:malate dehydrogenase (oxaloacetate-decarboxylating)(NADP+)
LTQKQAMDSMLNSPNHFGSMLLEAGQADAMVSGLTSNYSDTIKPALEIIGNQEIYSRVSGLYIVIAQNDVYFLTDTTVNIDPKANEIADITLQAAAFVKHFDIEPKVALLSYSNFGSAEGEVPRKMQEALKIINQRDPELVVDGDIQADVAVNQDKIDADYSFSKLAGSKANVLVFPNLTAGNTSYKLLNRLGNLNVIGPVLQGMNKSVHVLQKGSSINEIVDMTAIANVMAQNLEEDKLSCSVKY